MLALVAVELAVVLAVLPTAVATWWSPIAERYPARDVGPDATRRRYQSFRSAILSLSWCFHVAADQRYLHLSPTFLARLMGVRGASIPWQGIDIDPADARRRTRRAFVADQQLDAPRWCLDRAA